MEFLRPGGLASLQHGEPRESLGATISPRSTAKVHAGNAPSRDDARGGPRRYLDVKYPLGIVGHWTDTFGLSDIEDHSELGDSSPKPFSR